MQQGFALPRKVNNPPVLPDSVVAEVLDKRKPRKVTDSKIRDIILYVLKICKEECDRNELFLPLLALRCRVGMYVGVNESTVSNVKKADTVRKANGEARAPLVKRKTVRNPKTVLDDRDLLNITKILRDWYIKYRKVPTLKFLMPTILDQIPTYKHRGKFLYKVVENLGYKRKKYYSKRQVLIEDASVMAYRSEYLKIMKELRSNSNMQNVFYVYECVIDKTYTLHKSWQQKYGYNGALSDKCTMSFLCAGSESGFLKNSILLMRNEHDTPMVSWPGQLTEFMFHKWLRKYLIPNLPPNSIVIMDDAPHHCLEQDLPVSYYASRSSMCEYLKLKNVECTADMRRSELYKLVETHRPKNKIYVVDNILREHHHKAMRLPPYMIDLNPVQHAMDRIQQKLLDNEPTCAFNLLNASETMGPLMSSITPEEWKEFCKIVATLEDEFWEKDKEYEVALDEVILSMRDCIENGSDESEFDSDIEDSKT